MDRRDKNNGNNGNGDESRGTKRDRVSPPQHQQQAAPAALTGSAPQLQPIALTGPNNQSSAASAASGHSHSHGHHHKSGHHHHHHGKHAPTLLGMGKMDDSASRRTSKRKRAKVCIIPDRVLRMRIHCGHTCARSLQTF